MIESRENGLACGESGGKDAGPQLKSPTSYSCVLWIERLLGKKRCGWKNLEPICALCPSKECYICHPYF